MDLGLKGKRALVLGGNKGLGRGVAEALAAEGATVAVAGRDGKALTEAVVALRRYTPESREFIVDLSDAGALPAFLASLDQDFGAIDILLLNGGGPPPFPASEVDPVVWRGQFEAMVLSGMRIASHVLPGMRARRWGRVLAIASTSVREPIPGLTASNALRSAVAGWAKTLASEVACDGVTVNLLLPGRLITERTRRFDVMDAKERGVAPEIIAAESQSEIPVGRYGTPAELGAVAAFLASESASYVTGAAIPVDGGLSHSIL